MPVPAYIKTGSKKGRIGSLKSHLRFLKNHGNQIVARAYVLNKVVSEDTLLGLVSTYADEVKSKYDGSGSFLDKRMVLKSLGLWVEANRNMTKITMQVKIDGVALERA